MPINRWNLTIDLKDIWAEYRPKDLGDSATFTAYRDAVVARFRTSRWDEAKWLAEDFAWTENIEDFNAVLAEVYDYADRDRVWIATS